jgi:hypothetical protein
LYRCLPQKIAAARERGEELAVEVVRSVITTMVGFSIAGCRISRPA